MNNNIFKKSIRFIGIAVFLYILYKLNWKVLYGIFKEINIFHLLPVYLLIIPKDFAATYRWHSILKAFSIKRTYFNNITLYFSGLLAGFATPGRLGEFYRIFKLEKEGHSKLKTSFIVFLVRFFDLSLIFILSIVAVLYFLKKTNLFDQSLFNNISILGVFIIAVFYLSLFVFKNKTARLLTFFINKIFKSETKQGSIEESLRNVNILLFLKTFVLTAIIWGFHFYIIYIFAKVLNIHIPFMIMLYILILSTLAATLPITFIGLGTRELVLINLFSLYYIPAEKVIALSMLIYTIMVVESLISLIFWNIEHKGSVKYS